MRIAQLDIPAFGSFTDFSLTFPASKNDLHIIYAPNEGGKSTLLRALDHLFYGIPTQTHDSFQHPNPKLRLGATITSPTQGSLTFQRRKGRANTLSDPKGNALADSSLTAFLGAVDQNQFSSLFGLDTDSLRSGAQALLSGEGSVGSALFSASLGNTDIDSAITLLETEANTLFRPRSSTLSIPKAIKAYNESEKASRAAQLKTTVWKAHQKDLSSAQSTYTSANDSLKESAGNLRLLERYTSALPLIAQLQRAETRVAELLEIPDVPEDFTKRVREAQSSLRSAEEQVTSLQNQLTSFSSQLAALQIPTVVLDHASAIERLHQASPAESSRRESLPALKREHTAAQDSCTAFLTQHTLTPEQLDGLPPISPSQVQHYHDLESDLTEQLNRAESHTNSLAQLEKELTALELSLAETPQLAGLATLQALLTQAESARKSQTRITDLRPHLANLSHQISLLTSQCSLSELTRKGIQTLRVPSEETIHSERTKSDRLDHAVTSFQRELGDIDQRISQENAELAVLQKKGATHTKRDLIQARTARDAAVTAADLSTLPDLITQADTIADSLHSHAEEIALAEQHGHTITKLSAARENTLSSLTRATSEHSTWLTQWGELCQSIPAPPQPPADLIAWRKSWQELCKLLSDFHAAEREMLQITEDSEAQLHTLKDHLDSDHSDLSLLTAQLKDRADQLTRATGSREVLLKNRESLKNRIANLTQEANAAHTQLTQLQANKAALTAQLPAPPRIIHQAQTLLSAANSRGKELAENRSASSAFSSSLRQLQTSLSQPDTTPDSLWQILQSTRDLLTRRNTLLEGKAATETNLTTQQDLKKKALAHYKQLHTQSGASSQKTLEQALAAIEEKAVSKSTIRTTKQNLTQMTGGVPLDQFISAATAINPSDLQAKVITLGQEIEQLQTARDAAFRTLNDITSVNTDLKKASATAADYHQRAQLHLGTIITDSRRFIALQHAITFLRDQIERFREKAQGPMIRSTSAYFSQLTRGSFSHIVIQPNDKHVPQLAGVRSSGDLVPTSGMSEGTADQLYLALRLAAIDQHLLAHTPMPLILDDLLMTFDDARTSALLPVLATLSEKTQVLVFTHHEHILDLAPDSAQTHKI